MDIQQSGAFLLEKELCLFNYRSILWVRNVPDSNEMWLHNFGKGQAVLDSKTEGLCRGVE